MSLRQEAAADDELLARRESALDVSAWGEPFQFFQPRNLCLWVFLALVASGAVRMFSMFSGLAGYYGPAMTAAAALGVVSTLVWGWWFHHLDRFERQPFGLVLMVFLWGGLAAPFAIAIDANTALGALYTKLFGAVWSADWHAGLSAPFVEESAKAAGFVLAFGLAGRLVRTPADGIFLGAFVGLGFQTFEDFLYSVSSATGGFGADQVGSVTGGIALRQFSDVISHPLFSAVVCAGLVYLIGTPAQPRQTSRGVLLVLAGVGLHLVWDSMTALSGGNDVTGILLMAIMLVIGLTILWVAFRLADGRERELAHDILAPEAAAGVLTPDELTALTNHRERRRYLKAAGSGRERRRRRHVLAAALDLCAALAAGKGQPTADTDRARAEIRRLRG